MLHVGRDSPEEAGRVSGVTALLLSELDREDPAGDYVVERPLEVAAIAGRAGYDSLPAFSRAFKRHVGVSPGAFRLGSSLS